MSVAMPAVENENQGNQRPDWSPAPNGRIRDGLAGDADRNFSVAMHLSPFGTLVIGPLAFLAPLVLWLIRKDHSPFADDHGREILNFMISLVLWSLICFLAMFVLIGFVMAPVIVVLAIVSPIRAALAAGRGEYFRYPMTFRLL